MKRKYTKDLFISFKRLCDNLPGQAAKQNLAPGLAIVAEAGIKIENFKGTARSPLFGEIAAAFSEMIDNKWVEEVKIEQDTERDTWFEYKEQIMKAFGFYSDIDQMRKRKDVFKDWPLGDHWFRLTTSGEEALIQTVAPIKPKIQNNSEKYGEYGQMSLDIFISHSSQDAGVALALIELCHAACGVPHERIRCTSVDGYRLPVGVGTDELLRMEVRDARVFIGLITPASMKSAYVLFELGARWGAELHLAPLLACGADKSFLRGPLAGINALDCSSPAQMHQLVRDLSNVLQSPLGDASVYQRYVDNVVNLSKSIVRMGSTEVVGRINNDAVPDTLLDNISVKKYSEEDKKAILASWVGSCPGNLNTQVIYFTEVDKELKLDPGTTKKYIKQIAKKWDYTVEHEGDNTILFRNTPKESPRRRVSWSSY